MKGEDVVNAIDEYDKAYLIAGGYRLYITKHDGEYIVFLVNKKEQMVDGVDVSIGNPDTEDLAMLVQLFLDEQADKIRKILNESWKVFPPILDKAEFKRVIHEV